MGSIKYYKKKDQYQKNYVWYVYQYMSQFKTPNYTVRDLTNAARAVPRATTIVSFSFRCSLLSKPRLEALAIHLPKIIQLQTG